MFKGLLPHSDASSYESALFSLFTNYFSDSEAGPMDYIYLNNYWVE